MRILHFIPYYKPAWLYGGPIRSVSQLCESIAAEGHHVSVATTNSNGRNYLDVRCNEPVTVEGVTVYYFKRQPLPFYIESLALRTHIAALVADAEIVHLHHVWVPLCVAVARAAYDAGKPYVLSPHGSINTWNWENRSIRHKVFWRMQACSMVARASALYVSGELERRELLAVGAVPEKDIAVIPNPVNSAEYARNCSLADAFRRENGILPQQQLILYMGRLHPQKGIDLFLRAAAPCLHAAPQWLCLIAGPSKGDYIDILKAIVHDEGLESQVRFLGIIDGDTRLGALSAADLFVLTSHNENFGMGVVEAMAASVPVLVSTRVGLSYELAQAGAGCVTSLDRQSIEARLNHLMSEPDLRSRYAATGLALARERFDCGTVARQTIRVYQSVRNSSLAQQSSLRHVAPDGANL